MRAAVLIVVIYFQEFVLVSKAQNIGSRNGVWRRNVEEIGHLLALVLAKIIISSKQCYDVFSHCRPAHPGELAHGFQEWVDPQTIPQVYLNVNANIKTGQRWCCDILNLEPGEHNYRALHLDLNNMLPMGKLLLFTNTLFLLSKYIYYSTFLFFI